MTVKISDVLGYHSMEGVMDSQVKESKTLINAFNCCGYWPFISLISGLFRVIITLRDLYKMDSADPKRIVAYANLARGIIETLQWGLLFIIPDIIMTLGRMYDKKNHTQLHATSLTPN